MKIDGITTNLEMFLEQYNSKLLLENVNIGRLYLSIADNSINLNIEYNEGYHSDMLVFEESGVISKVEVWNDPNQFKLKNLRDVKKIVVGIRYIL